MARILFLPLAHCDHDLEDLSMRQGHDTPLDSEQQSVKYHLNPT